MENNLKKSISSKKKKNQKKLCLKVEDDLNFFEKGRRTDFFYNGRRPQKTYNATKTK